MANVRGAGGRGSREAAPRKHGGEARWEELPRPLVERTVLEALLLRRAEEP